VLKNLLAFRVSQALACAGAAGTMRHHRGPGMKLRESLSLTEGDLRARCANLRTLVETAAAEN
jgi:hypothetical protein